VRRRGVERFPFITTEKQGDFEIGLVFILSFIRSFFPMQDFLQSCVLMFMKFGERFSLVYGTTELCFR